MNRKKCNTKGFTLAELLIVVAIIAVLVAVAIPVFSAQLLKAKQATTLANFRSAKAEAAAAFLLDDENVIHEYGLTEVEIPGVKCPLSYDQLNDYLPTIVDELGITNGYAWSTSDFEAGSELYVFFTINENGEWDIDINNEPYN
ncbi:type IV pilin protein [Butyrivibrio sp. XB500-5]|uniref:type IV pilin protein n=1 Tax=Butyrivibrio sp. XB500-5 TaxID=2364880 RepID=UPI001FA94ADC|nr:prepilin-type N-terminal cleavage/methylation domain-containing protein [Butyrivibrio sp. XB500-5]